jgi:hypothetical protein
LTALDLLLEGAVEQAGDLIARQHDRNGPHPHPLLRQQEREKKLRAKSRRKARSPQARERNKERVQFSHHPN